MTHRTLVIGNPENRRVAMFLAALRQSGEDSADVVPWLDVIQSRIDWTRRLATIRRVRIESPGENAAVERGFIAAGADVEDPDFSSASRIAAPAALELPAEPGRILYPRQWFLGFKEVLLELQRQTDFATGVSWNHSVENILTMFDKTRCQQRLGSAGICIAPPLPRSRSYSELIEILKAQRLHRVFIKQAHGSSASGVVAFERAGSQQHAYTSAQIVRSGGTLRLYNSLKVRRYTRSSDIADLIDFLLREGAQIEAWLPKASLNGRRFDLRVVVIGGKARHVIVRTSLHPMTNLHLGNARGDLEQVKSAMSPEAWDSAMKSCERALAQFPGSLYAGVDLLIRTGFSKHAVLEVNAFGDLLPNALHDGQSTYEAELSAQPLTEALASHPQ